MMPPFVSSPPPPSPTLLPFPTVATPAPAPPTPAPSHSSIRTQACLGRGKYEIWKFRRKFASVVSPLFSAKVLYSARVKTYRMTRRHFGGKIDVTTSSLPSLQPSPPPLSSPAAAACSASVPMNRPLTKSSHYRHDRSESVQSRGWVWTTNVSDFLCFT